VLSVSAMTRLGLILLAALLLAGCPSKKQEPVAPTGPRLVHEQALLPIAFVPLKATLTEDAVRTAFVEFAAQPGCSASVSTAKRADYPGLGNVSLEFSLTPLDAPTRAAVQRAEDVVSVVLTWPSTEPRHLREAYEHIIGLAVAQGAVVFDRHAVSAYAVEDYRALRLTEGWEGTTPVGPNHFMVHIVPQENGLLMLDTGGLNRFGLNDLTLLDVNRASMNASGDLVNAVAQRLIEGARPDTRGWLRVRLEDLQEPGLKKSLGESAFDNAHREVVVAFGPPDVAHGARPEAIEISFPELTCANRGECQDAAYKQLFGFEDSVSNVAHDARVLEAKARALVDLMKYRAKAKKGLPPNEILFVKSRFPFDGGTEWMWVEVVTWTGDIIKGRLENEPESVALRAGATVEVKLEDVMDYEYRFKDRTFYGNETGRVLHPDAFEAVDGGRWRSRTKP
jgi:uncharacterized protein YegJ (DUF2314 family)